MARIRSIKPEFWTSEQVVECSTNARLLFIGLWNFADDGGILENSERQIKMRVFPGDDFISDDIRRMLVELSTNCLIEFYSTGNRDYIRVCGWNHQKIDRPSFKYPQPCGNIPTSKSQFEEIHSSNVRRAFTPGREGRDRRGGDSTKDSTVEENHSSNDIPEDPPDKPKPTKTKFDESHRTLAERMSQPVQQRFPSQKINLDDWADTIRKLIEIDKHNQDEIIQLWAWIINHQRGEFSWRDNCRTPMKLRERKDGLQYFEIIANQMRQEINHGSGSATNYRPGQRKETPGERATREREQVFADAEEREADQRSVREDGDSVQVPVVEC